MNLSNTAKKFHKGIEELERTPKYIADSVVFHIQENIAQELKRRGWTGADLAAAMGASRQAVTALLRSGANPTLQRIAVVAIALHVDPFSLLQQRVTSASPPPQRKRSRSVRKPA